MKHFLLFPLLVVLLGGVSAVSAEDWPQWHGPRRDAKSSETGLLKVWPEEGPKLLLTINGLGRGFSSPAIVGDRIYATGLIDEEQHIFCFDMEGNKKWEATNGPGWVKNFSGTRSTPTVDGDTLYTFSGFGRVAAFDIRSGEELWHVDSVEQFGGVVPEHHGYTESVVVDGNHVIYMPGGPDACFAALDKKTGETVWTSRGVSDRASHASAAVFTHDGIRQVASMTAKSLVAVSVEDGRFLWKYDRPAMQSDPPQNMMIPIYLDGVVFAASGNQWGGGAARLKREGATMTATQIWETLDMSNFHGGCLLADGYIYGNHEYSWNCLDFETGKLMYSEKGIGNGSIMYADGMLYCLGEKGEMALVETNPKEHRVVSSFLIPDAGPETWAHPAISSGKLFIRRHDNLHIYDVRQN